MLRLLLILFIPSSLIGANWYVDNEVSASGNGTSWAQAWKQFSNITWGGGGVTAGDILYISGGALQQIYSGTLVVGASGSAGNPITIRVGQESGRWGNVVFSGGIQCFRNYVTINGELSGARRFIVPNQEIDCSSAIEPKVLYCEVYGVGLTVSATFGTGGEFAYNYLHDVREDAAIRLNGRNEGVALYDQTLIHHNEIQVNGRVNDGTGPDGIQTGWGVSFYNNQIYSLVGTVTGAEHQDLIQTFGTAYHKFYNNDFRDTGDAMIGMDTGSTTGGNVRIYNNTFRCTVTDMGTVAVRLYNSVGSLTTITNFLMDNNTFVDFSRMTVFGAGLRVVANSPAVGNTFIRNNIFLNCGNGWPVMLFEGTTAAGGWSIDYNLLNAGAGGNTTIQLTGFGGQANPRAGLPSFQIYTAGSVANNLHLSTTDTNAVNLGTTLAYFSADKDGITRPQGTAWDLGAYERLVAPPPEPPAAPSIIAVRAAGRVVVSGKVTLK